MSEPPSEDDTRRIPAGHVLLNDRLVTRDELEVTPLRRPSRRPWWLAMAAAVLALALVGALVRWISAPEDALPVQQQRFLAAVAHGAERVREGNEVTVVEARRERRRVICALLGDAPVRNWEGTLSDIDTTLGGEDGMITVRVGEDAELRTSNPLLAGEDERSVIRPGTPAFAEIADLQDGDRVRFSGRFLPGDDGCFDETSLRARNGMLTPGFVFRFTAVAPR